MGNLQEKQIRAFIDRRSRHNAIALRREGF